MRILPVLLLVLLAAAAHRGRVELIRSWLRAGEPAPPPRQRREALPPAAPLRPVRVLLVDGLTAELADQLAAHRRLCDEGLRLTVAVGFPSVSLPVQHVLWTGAWQAESGVAFLERLPRRRLPALPELVGRWTAGGAVAVADAHREVVSAFGFSRVRAPSERSEPLPLLVLEETALAEARSAVPLVFVHFLALDAAGHRQGARSRSYLEAARQADRLLASLMLVRRPEWTLLALSDHGHLPGGGHGDAEEEVARVRACLAGPGIPAGRSLSIGMPDLSAVLAERLGVAAPAACRGSSLAVLLEGGQPASPPKPGPSVYEWGVALLALALGPAALLAFLGRSRRLRAWRTLGLLQPWSSALAGLLLACLGPPSLSHAFVYPALSPALLAVGLPAGLMLCLQLGTALSRGLAPARTATVLAAGVAGPALAAVVLGGWPLHEPPLTPFWSGWASSLLAVGAVQLAALALGWVGLVSWPPAQRRRLRRSTTTRG